MLIRTRHHWLLLAHVAFYAAMVRAFLWLEAVLHKNATFMIWFYCCMAFVMMFGWASTYTTLDEGLLIKRAFFFPVRTIALAEIRSIEPHRKNGKRGYGTMLIVIANSGKKLTLQPNHPEPFLKLLRARAPQAEYLL